MTLGRKKSAPPSSSPTSIISRVFPVSWFSKFKQKVGNFESKNKQRCVYEFPTPNSFGWREGRFYSMDENDSFWRLSIGDERIQGRRSTGGINPLWHASDHDFRVHDSGFKSFESAKMEVARREEHMNFSDMVSDIKMTKERREGKQRIVTHNSESGGKTGGNGEARVSTQRRKDMKYQASRKLRGLYDGEENNSNPGERYVFPIEIENMVSNSRKQSTKTIFDPRSVPGWQHFEDTKLKEIKIIPESKKKQININRESHSRRVKTYSPKTECKIRALEEMKKARTKSKKKERKELVLEGYPIFDSFAVVKSSYNPQQDFRNSMIEMIREKKIGHPEDLEELLACYLTLNCDEYHDLIIKVFRQVWFELKGVYIDPPTENGAYFDC